MEHIRQTRKSNCGQACLAMLTGRSIEEVEEILGKTGRTRTKDLVRFLRFQGWDCPDRLIRFSGRVHFAGVPSIVKLIWKKPDGSTLHYGHWVVRTAEDRWFDPARPTGELSPGGVISSVLPITKSAAKRSERVPS